MADAVLNWRRFGGYLVWLRAIAPPQMFVDAPIARLPAEAVQWSEFIDLLFLAPNTRYHVVVAAFNRSGFSEPARAVFTTDGAGTPSLIPAPVHTLRVTPLVGGEADIRWEYDELVGDAIADSFGVEITALQGGGPIDVPDVPYAGRVGQVRIAGADGVYRCKVFSKLAGLYEPAVQSVDFVLDGLGPVGQIYGPEAIS